MVTRFPAMRRKPLAGTLKYAAIAALAAYVIWAIARPGGRAGVAVQVVLLTLMLGTALAWLLLGSRGRGR